VIWPFRPHPPLALAHKVACERRFASLARQLGKRRPSPIAIVTPQDMTTLIAACSIETLPEQLLDFVRARMLPSENLTAEWAQADALTVNGQSLHYSILTDSPSDTTRMMFHPLLKQAPERLAAVAATAIAEHLLRSQNLIDDMPAGSFEVLPLLFGYGPLMAHAALHELPDSSPSLELTRTARVGAVSPLELGYTMALADWSLQMEHAEISSLLRLDTKEGLQKGLRYLEKTGDCCFEADFLERSDVATVGFQLAGLSCRSQSRQLNTLLDLAITADTMDAELAQAVAALLRHSEPDVQRAAAITLGRCSKLPAAIHDELVILAEDGAPTIRQAAVAALRPGYQNDSSTLDLLAQMLRRSDRALIVSSINAILRFDNYPEGLSDSVLKALSTIVLVRGPEDLTRGLQLLHQTHPAPRQALQQHFHDDPTALAILEELLDADPDELTDHASN